MGCFLVLLIHYYKLKLITGIHIQFMEDKQQVNITVSMKTIYPIGKFIDILLYKKII